MMIEKYNALWVGENLEIVFEEYLPEHNKLNVIYRNSLGSYLPFSYSQIKDPQWILPFWSPDNEKAMMLDLESAKEYLSIFNSDIST